MSDATLIGMCWSRWQASLFDHLVADCAFASWDPERRKLAFVRSPLSSVGLYWFRDRTVTLFSTHPNDLLDGKSVQPDVETLTTSFSENDVVPDGKTSFSGINALPPGRAVLIKPNGEENLSLWEPGSRGVVHNDIGDAAEALRSLLDEAVVARLDRTSGRVGSELSSGRDSSAVTTSAALALGDRNEHLLAFTGAPTARYHEESEGRWRSDETELAALTAANYSNIAHIICRTPDADPLDWFDVYHRSQVLPARGLNNLPWQMRVRELARSRGVTVLLRAGHGNWTISAGGHLVFPDLMPEQGIVPTLAAAAAFARAHPRLWLTALHFAIGPHLPRGCYNLFARARGAPAKFRSAPFLRQPYRTLVEDMRREKASDRRPLRNYRSAMRSYAARAHSTDHFTQDHFGIETRDPTADRRLVDHMLAQPAQHLLSTMDKRPMYELAFQARIPPAVLHARSNGMPGEDWMLAYQPARINAALVRYSQEAIVQEWVDTDAARDALATWPRCSATAPEYALFVQELLNTVSLASFLSVRFGSKDFKQ